MKNANTSTQFTAKERQSIENFCKVGNTAKPFGRLYAKKYVGQNNTLRFLNELKNSQGGKYVGQVQMINENGLDFWYLWAIDGETYRILEPSEGIDEVLELDFKRNDV